MSIHISTACIGCGRCVQSCPGDVLRVDEEKHSAFVKYLNDCQLCNICTFHCPIGAITLTPEKAQIPILSWG